jgi:hypothetical protein
MGQRLVPAINAQKAVVFDSQPNFRDGLNTTSDPSEVGQRQAVLMTNFRLADIGAVTKRGGTRIVSAVGVPSGASGIIYGFHFVGSGASPLDFCYVTDGTNWARAPYVGLPVTFANVLISGGLGTTLWTHAQMIDPSGNDVLIIPTPGFIGFNVNIPLTNVTTNYVGSGGYFTNFVVYNRRLWGWNYGINGTNLYFSPFDDPANLGIAANGGGVIKMRVFGSNGIMSCAVVGASLLIFHAIAGISRLSGFGQSDITAVPQGVSTDASLVAPRGIAVYNGIAYFLARRGLCAANEGAVTELNTPDKPDPTIAIIAQYPVDAYSAQVIYNRQQREIWVLIPNRGTWVYNTILKSWSGPFDGPYKSTSGFGMAWEMRDNSNVGDARVWMAPGGVSTIVECDRAIFRDNQAIDGTGGTLYTTTLQCHRMFGDNSMYAKSWRWANVLAAFGTGAVAGTITTQSVIGGSDTQVLSNLSTMQTPYYVNAFGVGPYLDVTFSDTSATSTVIAQINVNGYSLGQR